MNTQQIAKGVFSANTAAFSLPGKWEIQVEGVQTKPNSPNLVAIYEIPVKPNLDQLQFNVREFRIPGNNTSQPLYPLYDNSRNVIWVGDTSISSGSGRIFKFDLNSHKFTEQINGTNIVTVMALDRDGQIWYVDPLMKHMDITIQIITKTKYTKFQTLILYHQASPLIKIIMYGLHLLAQ